MLTNNPGVAIKIAESEERKLMRDDLLDQFNDKVWEAYKLGYLDELSQAEMDQWDGPVHYVSWQHVVNPGSVTTSLQIVVN